MKRRITVMSAEEALVSAYRSGPFRNLDNPNYAIISITDEKDVSKLPVWFRPSKNIQKVWHIPFADIPQSELDPNDKRPMIEQIGLDADIFGEKQATIIWNAANELAETDWHILVHCEAGVSRSQAVAAFLEVFLNNDVSKLEKRLHEWNSEYFATCWAVVKEIYEVEQHKGFSFDYDHMQHQKAILFSQWEKHFISQRELYSTDSFWDKDNIALGHKDKHILSSNHFGPEYPDRTMLTLRNQMLINEFYQQFRIDKERM